MIEKHLTHPDSPIMVVVWEESRPLALVSRKLPQCPKEKEERKDTHLNAQFQRIARRDKKKKPSSVISTKAQRKTI